jgi:hypothetical protein
LVRRFVSHGALNAPWGITWAPASFWGPANSRATILIGNFGDGRINAYDENGSFLGPLRREGKPIVIDGLWALSFAPASATSVNPDWLFFAAGPKDEGDGLFGYIKQEAPDHPLHKQPDQKNGFNEAHNIRFKLLIVSLHMSAFDETGGPYGYTKK